MFNAITKLGGDRGDEASARHRHGAGRRLPRPPRAGLSGGLHPVAGAVAQAAGRALGRPGAVGGPAADRRPRDRDRGVQHPGILDASRPTSPPVGDPFLARLVKHEGKRLTKFDLGNEASAHAARAAVEAAAFKVHSVEKKPARRSPAAALHHLDPAAGGRPQARLLGRAHHAGGPEAVRGGRHRRRDRRPDHLHADRRRADRARGARRGARGHRRPLRRGLRARERPRIYKIKAKNAQEAHEAIRPTSLARNPGSLRLEPDLGRLYELIWKRMIASQMEAARIERTTIELESEDGKTGLRATGQVVLFDGYLRGLRGGPRRHARGRRGRRRDRRPPARRRRGRRRPRCSRPAPTSISPSRRRAIPRPRLVKKMEELGIGRPSTYASILTVLRDRAYVRMDKNRFVPEDKGRLVTAFLEQFFRRYVEYDFTAALEEKLDLVSAGELDWKALLRDFWTRFPAAVGEIGELRMRPGDRRAERGAGPAHLPGQGRRDRSARLPDLRHRPAVAEDRQVRRLHRLLQLSGVPLHPPDRPGRRRGGRRTAATASWASIPPAGHAIWLKAGRFGPYVEGQGRQAQARQPAQGLAAGGDGPRQGDAPAAPAARGRAAPGRRRHDPGRHRPLRPLRPAQRRPTPTCRQRRRGVRGRPQPRRDRAGREARRRRAAAAAARRR